MYLWKGEGRKHAEEAGQTAAISASAGNDAIGREDAEEKQGLHHRLHSIWRVPPLSTKLVMSLTMSELLRMLEHRLL